jgi:site-specific DNA-methyltransferase (adenine-specific)
LTEVPSFQRYIGKVKLVVTSPPYLDVVNYAKQNWIRCWFLGEGANEIHETLDDNLTLNSWLELMNNVVAQMGRMLTADGVIVFVMGDVVRSSRSVVSLAREFLRHVMFKNIFDYVGCFSDYLQIGLKTTRIWRDTKGQATTVDRVILLSNRQPSLRTERLGAELFGNPERQVSGLDAKILEGIAMEFTG